MSDIVPIGDPQAKAIEETAKAASKLLDIPRAVASYIARIVGTIPEDIAGLYIGDPLRLKRVENLIKHQRRVEELLGTRGVKETVAVSPNIAAPILENASNETRAELQEVWARLMAAAADPGRSNLVRQSFVDAAKRMDPLDALIIEAFENQRYSGGARQHMSARFYVTEDEVEVSFTNLASLGFIGLTGPVDIPQLTAAGRQFKRALRS